MPKPHAGESREQYMARCVPMVMGEGKANAQAVAMCSTMWERRDAAMSDDGLDLVDRPARLFRAGDYPDKGFSATENDLDTLIANTRRQVKVPVDLHHADTDETLDTGRLLPETLRRDGAWVIGTLRLPRAIDQALKARGLSVAIDRAQRFFRKITVTPRPRVPGAGFAAQQRAAEGDLIVFDGGELMPEDTKTVTQPAGQEGSPGGDEKPPSWFTRFFASRQATPDSGAAAGDTTMSALPTAPDTDLVQMEQRLRAEFGNELAAVKAENAGLKQQVAAMSSETTAERLAARLEREVQLGVPPYQAELLVPAMFGVNEIEFAEGDETVKLSVAQAIGKVLESMRDAVPMGGRLPGPTDRQEDVGFEGRWETAFSKAKTEHPDWTTMQCNDAADAAAKGAR